VETGQENHEDRLKLLEAWSGSAGSNKNLKIVQRRGPSEEDKLKEIEAECNAVKDRI